MMPTSRNKSNAGSSLVEVMIALLIVTVLVLGVAAFIYHGRASVYAQRDRLSVLEFVNGRMELLRAEPYTTVQPPTEDYQTYYLIRNSSGAWVGPRSSVTREWITINSAGAGRRRYRMTTTVRYIDVDGGTASYDALEFTVAMRYRPGSTDEIAMSTYRAP